MNLRGENEGGDISHDPPAWGTVSHRLPRPAGAEYPIMPRASPHFRGGPEAAGPGGDGGAGRAAAAASHGGGGAGPGPGLAGRSGTAVPGVPEPLRAAELLGGGATALPRPAAAVHGPDRYRPPAPIGWRARGHAPSVRPRPPAATPHLKPRPLLDWEVLGPNWEVLGSPGLP